METVKYRIQTNTTVEQAVTLPFYYEIKDPYSCETGRIYYDENKKPRRQAVIRGGTHFIYSDGSITELEKPPVKITREEFIKVYGEFLEHMTERTEELNVEGQPEGIIPQELFLTPDELRYIAGQ